MCQKTDKVNFTPMSSLHSQLPVILPFIENCKFRPVFWINIFDAFDSWAAQLYKKWLLIFGFLLLSVNYIGYWLENSDVGTVNRRYANIVDNRFGTCLLYTSDAADD